jgi:UDP-2-acetamido-2,6-beta-L-arabino-hexul-4-ose reductase
MKPHEQKIAITGSNGFVGQNLTVHLRELGFANLSLLSRSSTLEDEENSLRTADIIFHLAGVNRPANKNDFITGNVDYTNKILEVISKTKATPHIIYASTTKATENSDYGRSKLAAENCVLDFAKLNDLKVSVYRLPNIFGKWCKPNYNSAIATFCHNLSRGLEITINDPSAKLSVLYIDDLVKQWVDILDSSTSNVGIITPDHVFDTTVGEVSDILRSFAASRQNGILDGVGIGLSRALYATYISHIPNESFAYDIVAHSDPRGSFSEILKTQTSGQFSFFTAHPGITRGGHYHHTKTEKFIVVKGRARFRFRHILTNETYEVFTSDSKPTIVETIPGWAHDVTNIGSEDLIALLWANEIFDREKPDTLSAKVF